MAKSKFYSLEKILAHNATYNMIIGKRSNGKTYAVQKKIIEDYWNNGSQGAIIRRWEEDLRGKRGQAMFQALVDNGEVQKLTKGEWDRIKYYSGKWFFARYDEEEDKIVSEENPFCYAFALTTAEHDKSTSYPKVQNILFDEFLTRQVYLPDEFVSFMNVLSTIIRQRSDVTIFMLGNTVNKYCPYFSEMNLTGVAKQKQGTIDIYTYVNNPELKVAVEYCGEGISKDTRHASDKYFGFDNPKLNMITTGAWEIAVYPRLPQKYKSTDVKLRYYIQFEGVTLQCEIVHVGELWFTFIHRWTRDIEPKQLVYQTGYDARLYVNRKITRPKTRIEKFIVWFYQTDRVFYADNETGEIVRNYLLWCQSEKITN